MAYTQPWNKSGGAPTLEELQERDLQKMYSDGVVHFRFGFFVQLLLQTSLIQGAIIPQPGRIATANATLGADTGHCADYEGWVGKGINKDDCAEALREIHAKDVVRRGGQKYEFLDVWVEKTSDLPIVRTPWKHVYGE